MGKDDCEDGWEDVVPVSERKRAAYSTGKSEGGRDGWSAMQENASRYGGFRVAATRVGSADGWVDTECASGRRGSYPASVRAEGTRPRREQREDSARREEAATLCAESVTERRLAERGCDTRPRPELCRARSAVVDRESSQDLTAQKTLAASGRGAEASAEAGPARTDAARVTAPRGTAAGPKCVGGLSEGHNAGALSSIWIKNKIMDGVVVQRGLTDPEVSLMVEFFRGLNLCVKTGTWCSNALLYLVPVLNRVRESESTLQAVVLVHSRQAAARVLCEAQKCCKNTGIRVSAMCGCTSMSENVTSVYEGAHVLVATPGRFLDHMQRGADCRAQRLCLVLDAAEFLMHTEKYGTLSRIFELVPERQTVIFSFKFGRMLREFAEQKLGNYKFYNLLYETAKLKHYSVFVANEHKFYCLCALLERVKTSAFLVWCCSPRTSRTVVERLGAAAAMLHACSDEEGAGEPMEQKSAPVPRFFVCDDTHVPAHVSRSVKCLINFDSPHFPDQYFDRVSKIGSLRYVVTMLTDSEVRMKQEIEKRISEKIHPVSDSSLDALAAG